MLNFSNWKAITMCVRCSALSIADGASGAIGTGVRGALSDGVDGLFQSNVAGRGSGW